MVKEYVDIFDANYNYLGVDSKDSAHENGLWHQVFHCWVVNPKNRTLILQLRSAKKSVYPNMLDISAAGHLQAGESVIDGVREVEEELGIEVNKKDLIYLGEYIDIEDMSTNKINSYKNREFVFSYFLKDERSLNEYIPQKKELDGVFEIKIADAMKLFSSEINKLKINGVLGKKNRVVENVVSYGDFVPRGKRYFLKICIMAERLCDGEKHLTI